MSAHAPVVNVHENKAQCPECQQWFDVDECLQVDDYVTIPMFWCPGGTYDKGCGYFFLDPKHVYMNWDTWVLYIEDVLPTLFVERLTDHVMATYECPRPLTDNEMIRLLDTYVDDHGYDTNVVVGVQNRINDFSKMNISVTVQSYNVMRPQVPYHRNVCLEHDGISIYCTVRMPDGTVKMQRYWGD
jgi:hypothetical protein